ncbi:MAG TPA: apolipoprotein N-acyltransferase, partial [Thermoguttaceae bacterium]|nr:apolipoprotein N-acyltransferase [Thermoguttaceae bacterium]
NSAIHVAADGQVLGHYDKMHRVLFGEYIPFADSFPWLHNLTPLPSSLNAGREPTIFHLGPLLASPNICYETVLPHVIRRQVKSLRDKGTEPDVLVNLTNDGWFWGSAELDMHLICGVFRAVECRKPLLIAANTGFSAQIDGNGRILSQGPRRATGTILAEVGRDGRRSVYLWCGDWPSGICLLACLALGLIGASDRIRARQP